MYNAVFISDSGLQYNFGVSGSTVFDMDVGDGIPVNIGVAQGFSQVGQTVESLSVSGRNINVTGAIYAGIQERKNAMRKVFAPFVSGRLIFENKYYTNVYVKNPPSFSPVKNNGKFSMRLFAPYPYFFSVAEEGSEIGTITPRFMFPVNYGVPHWFGVRSGQKYSNIVNSGDVEIPFSVNITAFATSQNPVITNMETGEYLKINGTLNPGETIKIYRDKNHVLRAEMSSGDSVQDAISLVDEGSSLFSLRVGDNIISANDDGGGSGLSVRFSYNLAVGALYET